MNSDTISQSIQALLSQVEEKKKELRTFFQKELFNLMKEKGVVKIVMGVNNYEFNDGSPEYFSLYYEDLEITLENGESCDWHDKNEKLSLIRGEFVSFFHKFESIHEDLFKDFSGSITIQAKEDLIIE